MESKIKMPGKPATSEDLVPKMVTVLGVRQETPDIRSLRLGFENAEARRAFAFRPGQFCLVSVLGVGEAVFCIASPPSWEDAIEVSVKKVGRVTAAIHDLEVGERVGLRGPYGNWFPYEAMLGRNIVFVGGGIGLAPLRPLVWQTLSDRSKFKDVCIIYGARTVADLVYTGDLAEWAKVPDVRLIKTVDPGGEDAAWDGKVGLVPAVLDETKPSSDGVLVVCGPPIMIKFALLAASKLGFRPEDVITTLEMKMKCGVGLCGRCNIGNRYVCRDGPVFTLKEMQALPDEF
ncbi:MAG TPA: FAD/NAD(P)-binding protein [bacterium]|nr:FAD/NAD(P)-binding protein [bacterium]